MPISSPAPAVEPEAAPGPALVVSIHDVSPLTWEATERILERLEKLGLGATSLLVVPDHHQRGHFLDHPEFCSWLRCRAQQGDEPVIHGYFHRRNRRPRETLRERLTTRFYTAGEGEFFDIAGADALWLVSQARQDFRKIGLDPQGFIAPAWLLSAPAEAALRKLGLAYTTRLGSVIDLARGQEYASQSLVWSVRSLWRRLASRRWNASLYKRLRAAPLLRIGIHPVDLEHPSIWGQIEALTERALAERQPLTYLRWIETSRTAAHALQS